jgi:hypothetical protein
MIRLIIRNLIRRGCGFSSVRNIWNSVENVLVAKPSWKAKALLVDKSVKYRHREVLLIFFFEPWKCNTWQNFLTPFRNRLLGKLYSSISFHSLNLWSQTSTHMLTNYFFWQSFLFTWCVHSINSLSACSDTHTSFTRSYLCSHTHDDDININILMQLNSNAK